MEDNIEELKEDSSAHQEPPPARAPSSDVKSRMNRLHIEALVDEVQKLEDDGDQMDDDCLGDTIPQPNKTGRRATKVAEKGPKLKLGELTTADEAKSALLGPLKKPSGHIPVKASANQSAPIAKRPKQ